LRVENEPESCFLPQVHYIQLRVAILVSTLLTDVAQGMASPNPGMEISQFASGIKIEAS